MLQLIGMQTLDQSLEALVEKRVVSREVARERDKMPESF